MEGMAFLFPETVGNAVAINARDQLAAHVGNRFADLIGGDFAFAVASADAVM